MDRDISALMMDTVGSPGNDEFGIERDTKRPLLLDSVTGGKPRVSGSRLLRIPAEVLAHIVEFIADDKPTLAALALVNSDCRQLARSCQFVDICFDYSPQAFDLLRALRQEAAKRSRPVSRPTIGACIRKITVKSDPHHVASVHWEVEESMNGATRESYTAERKTILCELANDEYFLYRLKLLAATYAMPHLETIAWYDRVSVDTYFFRTISRLPIKHLKLSQVPIEEPYIMEPPLTPAVIQLQSLYIDTRLSMRHSGDIERFLSHRATSPFLKSLLLRCAPTLESLVWSSIDISSEKETISFGDELISFPRLRQLKLPWLPLDSSTLLSFFSAPLRGLALPTSYHCKAIGNVLLNCEPLRDLQTLEISFVRDLETADALVGFLEKHTNLQKLYIMHSFPPVLDSRIIPLLSAGNFSNLLSLSLSWSGPDMDDPRPHIATVAEESIAAIGKIASLEQLCLTAGEEIGWPCQWLVNHEALRANLKGLTKLKKLAICRDTYQTDAPGVEVEEYYTLYDLNDHELIDEQARSELDEASVIEFDDEALEDIWERAHCRRMLRQTEKYAAAMPSLEWIYCGQWPMAIQERGNGTARAAIPLTKGRDTCYTALGRMFSMGNDD